LKKYQKQFQYILVDEYQDTNRPQFELVKSLAAGHRQVCVVGDDDQSIYSWRGADITNILNFSDVFADARVFKLEQNYRSTQIILNAAGAVVEHNKRRAPKTLWTAREGGAPLQVYVARDEREEAEKIMGLT
jgi:DNA helicase-2/ATP-dependent DNA helicase PcrA